MRGEDVIDIYFERNPRHADAANPALQYLSRVAWPSETPQDRANRDGFWNALVAAIYKSPPGKPTRHAPPDLPRIKPADIPVTVRKTIHCIEQQRLPAALMVLREWVRKGMTDLTRTGLTTGQQSRLADAFSGHADALAAAAGRLRQLSPLVNSTNVPDMLRWFHDLGKDAWVRSRPALAMTLALPVSWSAVAASTKGRDEFSAIAALCYDPSWVLGAINNAGVLAGRLMQTLDDPPSRLLVPREKRVRTDARLVPIDCDKLYLLLNPHQTIEQRRAEKAALRLT
jgi:hypothetical protein